jgi:hypothetical protein
MFSSRGIDENVILHSVNEKKLVKFINKVKSNDKLEILLEFIQV